MRPQASIIYPIRSLSLDFVVVLKDLHPCIMLDALETLIDLGHPGRGGELDVPGVRSAIAECR
jgi:hypothetical protein